MPTSTVFINNRTQAVRIPAEVRLPDNVRQVSVRARGHERIIAPTANHWDSFFLNGPKVSADFMKKRPAQKQSERESF